MRSAAKNSTIQYYLLYYDYYTLTAISLDTDIELDI